MGNGSTSLRPLCSMRDVAFFDVDVGRAVFAHGAQLHQVAVGLELAQREQQVQRAHHVVHLGEDRVLAVDHGIGRGALLGEMNHGVRLEVLDRGGEKVVVGHVADEELDVLSGDLLPTRKRSERGESASASGRRARGPTAGGRSCRQWRPLSLLRQIQRRRPATVAIAAEHGNSHFSSSN